MSAQPAPDVDDVAAEHVVHDPVTLPAGASVGDVQRFFDDDHLHLALLVRDGRLLGCLERGDVATADPAGPALALARTTGLTVRADEPMATVWAYFTRTTGRRLAVVDDAGRLVGLLCLKRTRTGLCRDRDVADRAAEHRRAAR